ncbi:MAG: hypothetical protein PWP46_555 [Fusobacteriaceae bacterium]|jgi:nitroimidazol reductase NimA-like FMN-containing flavoprotein (pyridoxamine 5'-phosphate oxidase superfamily)|nr:pyridoxamine 5-phosphate oxidase-related FMN-binding protein [Fusobacteriales bacterium]MDN5303676.1 hypothetical protein [Fusobacteriaceae bacterium]
MDLKEKIINIMDTHGLVRIATISLEGLPKVRSVDFARDKENLDFYFMTFKNTDKVKELEANNNVYITIDKDAKDMLELSQIKYRKGNGKAMLLDNPEEIKKAMGLILEKYPYLKDLPGDPSMMNFYKVKLDKIYITDNSVKFGHVDIYEN